MGVIERIEKLDVEMQLVNIAQLARDLGLRRQYIHALSAALKSGDLIKIIKHFDKDSPLDSIRDIIK